MRESSSTNAIQLVTLDLDDTLWAIAPVIERAEVRLHAWLQQNCPSTASQFNPADLRSLRQKVEKLRPELSGDFGALRLESIRLALAQGGDDEALAERAFDAFWTARNEVTCFGDVLPAIERLKQRYRLAAITNGNACLHRAGLAQHFEFVVTAREAGHAKPAREIFHQACERAAVRPAETLHVGDDLECDVRGALRAGLHAAWINRDTRHLTTLAPPAMQFASLEALADHLD